MIPALKSVVRNLFIRLAIRWPFLGDALARFLDFLPHQGAAARLCLWIAQAKSARGERDAAIAFCQKAILRRPSLTMALLMRGELYLGREDYALATADFQRALACAAASGAERLFPRIHDHLYRCHESLGRLLASEGQPHAALCITTPPLPCTPTSESFTSGAGNAGTRPACRNRPSTIT